MKRIHSHYEDKAFLIALIAVVGMAFSVAFHYATAFYGEIPKAYPLNTFLANPVLFFGDFSTTFCGNKPNPYSECRRFVYFPFAAYCIKWLTSYTGEERTTLKAMFLLFTLSSFLVSYILLNAFSPIKRVFLSFVFGIWTYGFLFVLDRANIEAIVFFFIAAFFICRLYKLRYLEIFFLAGAISLKAYPATLALLLLNERRFKDILVLILFTALMTFGALMSYPAPIGELIRDLRVNLKIFQDVYMFSTHGMQHNSSLYIFLKLLLFKLKPHWYSELGNSLKFLQLYSLGALFFPPFFAWLCWKDKEMEEWKIVCLGVFSLLLLPQISFDYKLAHVSFVVLYFVRNEREAASDYFYAVCLGLLLIPKDYLLLHEDISISGFLNPLLMLLVISLISYQSLVRIRMLLSVNKSSDKNYFSSPLQA